MWKKCCNFAETIPLPLRTLSLFGVVSAALLTHKPYIYK